MKNGKKPTREQRKLLLENDFDTYDWLVVKDTPSRMVVSHRDTGEIATIEKD